MLQLIWTGSRHNLGLLEGCGPSLHFGDDVIKRSSYVRLALLLRRILVLTGTFQMSARHVSSGFGS